MANTHDEWEYEDEREAPAARRQRLATHRGVLILVLGILGLVACQLLGIVAWVMGNDDLRAMDEGRMDPEGRDLTQAGRVCGIIATVLMAFSLLFVLIFFLGVGLSTGR